MSITYNFGQIADVAANINTFQNSMQGQLDDLYREFQQLFANDWSGQAGTACNEAQQQWNQGAAEIRNALASVGVKLAASGERLHQVDTTLAAGM